MATGGENIKNLPRLYLFLKNNGYSRENSK